VEEREVEKFNKSMYLKNNKLLKKRRRDNKIKKQFNYESKTHKGTNREYLTENLKRKEREDLKEKKEIKKNEIKLGLGGE
jgi:hypothetical protein